MRLNGAEAKHPLACCCSCPGAQGGMGHKKGQGLCPSRAGHHVHAHLALLAADLAQPDGVRAAVGRLHAALGADVLGRKQKSHWGNPEGVISSGLTRWGGGGEPHLLAVLADDAGGAARPQLLPAEDAAVHAVPQHAAAHVLQAGHQAPGGRGQGTSRLSPRPHNCLGPAVRCECTHGRNASQGTRWDITSPL